MYVPVNVWFLLYLLHCLLMLYCACVVPFDNCIYSVFEWNFRCYINSANTYVLVFFKLLNCLLMYLRTFVLVYLLMYLCTCLFIYLITCLLIYLLTFFLMRLYMTGANMTGTSLKKGQPFHTIYLVRGVLFAGRLGD